MESEHRVVNAPKSDLAEPPAPDAPRDPVLDRFWIALRRLPRYLRLVAGLARDPSVPKRAKAALAIGGLYTVSPIDLVPGIIPVAGQLDDLFVLLFAVRHAIRACPPPVALGHLERVGITLSDIDDDVRAVRATARWLAVKGVRAGGSMTQGASRTLQRLWRNRRKPTTGTSRKRL